MTTSDTIKIFKSIKVRRAITDGSGIRYVNGYMNYLRHFYQGYNYKYGDILDRSILHAARTAFTYAKFHINNVLILDGQLENYREATRGNSIENSTMVISPLVPVGKTSEVLDVPFNVYNILVKINIQANWSFSQRVNECLNHNLRIGINYRKFDTLVKTIEEFN